MQALLAEMAGGSGSASDAPVTVLGRHNLCHRDLGAGACTRKGPPWASWHDAAGTPGSVSSVTWVAAVGYHQSAASGRQARVYVQEICSFDALEAPKSHAGQQVGMAQQQDRRGRDFSVQPRMPLVLTRDIQQPL